MSQEIVVQQADKLNNLQRLGNMLAASGYFADTRDMAQAAVRVMAGEELGLAPVASMMGINIIKGRVTLSANLMATLVKRSGYQYKITRHDSTGCSIQFTAPDGSVLGTSDFTEVDARQADLLKGDNYKKHPRNMYFARAMSNGVRWYCPEITSGIVCYTPDELGEKEQDDQASAPAPAAVTVALAAIPTSQKSEAQQSVAREKLKQAARTKLSSVATYLAWHASLTEEEAALIADIHESAQEHAAKKESVKNDVAQEVKPRMECPSDPIPPARINAAQLKRLHTICSRRSISDETRLAILGTHGYESSKDIEPKGYDAICIELEQA